MLECDRVHKGLWMGSMPPSGDECAKAGFSMVVLCAEREEYPYSPSLSSFAGVSVVLHAPNDDAVLSEEQARIASHAASLVASHVRHGGRALITCRMGLNRSGLVTALALHLITHHSGLWCVRRVQVSRKASAARMGFLGALYNRSFVSAILKLRESSVRHPIPRL